MIKGNKINVLLGGEKMENVVILSLDEYNTLKGYEKDFIKIYKALTFGVSTVTADGEMVLNVINERYCNGENVFKEFKTR